jgi:2-methylisocitrate lyase-like PEP mutase family enzyme
MSGPQPSARALFEADGITVLPGAGSPLEARLIEQHGFAGIYVSGYATAAAVYGLPDIGLIGLAEIAANLTAIRHVTELPLIVDADTGYGDVVNVRDTVRRLEDAGASAIQLEDQVWPKRCGHLAGKEVIDADVMAQKIRAAVAARRNPDLVIIARTDARAPLGLDEAIRRATLYHGSGADVSFIDAPHSIEELARIATEVPGPSMANMSETGLTPALSAAELEQLGFAAVIFPTSALRIAAHAVDAFLGGLALSGDSREWTPSMASLDTLNRTVGIAEAEAFEASVAAIEAVHE